MTPLISTEWLQRHLTDADLAVIDATWDMPDSGRTPHSDFLNAHIPGAVFADIDVIADTGNPLPHMLPAAADFAAAMSALGLDRSKRLVIYDDSPVRSAARMWWMFRAFGHARDRVHVLDGGLAAWKTAGAPLDTGAPAPARGSYEAEEPAGLVRTLDQMREIVSKQTAQIIDARSAPRFSGKAPEPRAGLRSGHMPGACNLPYAALYEESGHFKSPDALRQTLKDAGVDLDRPLVTTCGSGVTAAALSLALALLGRWDVPVYDGSWAEWGAQTDTPVT